ncbi:hypothetical protein M407DRAFT_242251, partial [Tulasnella calospora MUT 4182]
MFYPQAVIPRYRKQARFQGYQAQERLPSALPHKNTKSLATFCLGFCAKRVGRRNV